MNAMGNADVYEAARQRIGGLVKEADADVEVPTCPGWTVKDVVAHLAGSLAAYSSGSLEGASSPEWGERQVKERREVSLENCLGEWDQNMAASEGLFESKLGAVAVADVLAHEQDIRTALGRPGNRNEEGIVAAVEMGLAFFEHKMQAAELPPLRIVTDDLDKVLGDGEPAATLRISTFELFRSLHGRRSPKQVRALDWDTDPTPWLDVFFLFGPAEHDVHE
jgi:uncharacterized protein (TIGR03083 family)